VISNKGPTVRMLVICALALLICGCEKRIHEAKSPGPSQQLVAVAR